MERLFNLLLRLYPGPFRREYAANMVAAFDEGWREAMDRGGRGRFVLTILRDFAVTVPRVWLTHCTERPRRRPTSFRKEPQVMGNLWMDLRYALRGLVLKPGLAVVSVVALGLGIGLTTAMFSIVNGVVLRGLPVEEPQEIMAFNRVNPSQSQSRLLGRIHDFFDLRERQTTFEGLSAMALNAVNVSAPGTAPELIAAADVSANTFDLLGVSPVIGRGFVESDEDPGSPAVAVVGYRFWQDRLDGRADVVGSTIRVDGTPTEVIGVMMEGFEFPVNQQLWQPLRVNILEIPRGEGPGVLGLGRLADGVTIEQAQADLDRIMQQLGSEYPDTNEGMTMVVGPFVRELLGYQTTPLLFTMLGAVSLVLLIACANVTNLLLARASLRSKEVAVRTALGASRRRVISQLLMESSVIAVAGAAVGIGVATLGIGAFNRALAVLPQGLPFWFAIGIDVRVMAFVLALTVGSSLLSGLVPALRASRADVQSVLKDESRGTSSLRIGRLSRGLVVLEVAFSCALLVAAGLMVKSVTGLANVEYAFATDNIFSATVTLPVADYPDPESQTRFYDELRDRLRGEPGVLDVSISSEPPMVGFGNGRVAIDGSEYLGDRDYPSARIASVDPSYFSTLDASLVQGREFGAEDVVGGPPVAIVNESFVATHFADENPIGRRVRIHAAAEQGTVARRGDTWYTVVGVAPDFYLDTDLFVLAPEAVYFPMAQRPQGAASILVRTSGEPLNLTTAVREAVASIDPDLPISSVNTLGQAIADQNWFFTVFGVMFTVFGAVALVLAAIGLYGVLSFNVNQRQHELGLRVALGARPGQVVGFVLRQGMMQLAVGMMIGVGLALLLGRAIAVLLYDVAATDLSVLVSIGAILTVTGVAACLLPARRATRADPMIAMRAE